MSESNRDNTRLLKKMIKNIQEILRPKHRCYLKVFDIAADITLTDAVFEAVFNSIKAKEGLISKY